MKKNILGIFIVLIVAYFGTIFLLYLNSKKEEAVLQGLRRDAPVFVDGKTKLNSGYEMPVIGYNAWSQGDNSAADSVYYAIKTGYRLIEAVQADDNEKRVGEGIKRAIDEGLVKRDELFVMTRINPKNEKDTKQSIEQSLSDLGLDYIDLLLLHQPSDDDIKIYKEMENFVNNSKIHSLGLANYYNQEDIDDILVTSEKVPAVLQNENHIFFQSDGVRDYVGQYGIVFQSWHPFGEYDHTGESVNSATVAQLAEKYGRTPAQIVLRWHFQSNFVAMPGSVDSDHMAEDINIFDFSLSDEDMKTINQLNEARRVKS